MVRAVVFCAFGVLAIGCGSQRPEVVPTTGRILIGGKPLTGVAGFVRVEPADTRPATGAIDEENGSFTLTTFERNDGCVAGTHPVAVIVKVTAGGQVLSLVPEKYADASTSGLSVAISGKAAAVTIELEGELKQVPKATEQDVRNDTPGY